MDFCAGDEQLKRNFSCKICFEPFSKDRRHPISLNCGHTFCARCVMQLGRTDTIILCGLCRKGTYSDFRQLGKNVTLLDLLEYANLLSKDDPTELEEWDENASHIQPWRGANHFLSNNALTTFLDRHAHLRSIVHQLLLPTHWPEFDEQLDAIRCSLFNIEDKLREAGDSFVFQEGQLDQLERKFHFAMTEYYLQQQQQQRQSSFNDASVNFVPIRWAISDDSDDDINVLAVSTTNVEPMSTTNVMPSDNGRSTFGVRRPWGCPPLTRNSERRRTRRSKKRTRGTNNGASFGIPALNFVFGVDGDDQPMNFNTWGVIGNDEWDQSTRTNDNYMCVGILEATSSTSEEVPEQEELSVVSSTISEGMPPISGELSEEKPPISEETLPISEDAPLISGEKPPISGEKPPISGEKPPILEETPSISEKVTVLDPPVISPPTSEEVAEPNVMPTHFSSSANRIYAQYISEMVGSLLEKMSSKEVVLFRKELNDILEKHEERLIEG